MNKGSIMGKVKKILRAYSLAFDDISHAPNLIRDLSEYIHKVGNTSEDRMMPVENSHDIEEVDFISWYYEGNNYIFGCILRMEKGVAKRIFKEQLQKTMIAYEDIEAKEKDNSNIEGFIVNRYYFCLNDKYVILALRHSVDLFETYINFLLEKINKSHYIINNMLKDLNNKSENFVEKIVIGNKSHITKDITKDIANNSVLKKMFGFFNTLYEKEYEISNIIRARIVLTIKNPDEVRLFLKAMPDDYITVQTSDGKIIDGSQYKVAQIVNISTNKNNSIIKEQLKQEMVSFLYKVSNNKEVI